MFDSWGCGAGCGTDTDIDNDADADTYIDIDIYPYCCLSGSSRISKTTVWVFCGFRIYLIHPHHLFTNHHELLDLILFSSWILLTSGPPLPHQHDNPTQTAHTRLALWRSDRFLRSCVVETGAMLEVEFSVPGVIAPLFHLTDLGLILLCELVCTLSLSPYVTHFLTAFLWCGHLFPFSCASTMNRSFYPCVCVSLITPH